MRDTVFHFVITVVFRHALRWVTPCYQNMPLKPTVTSSYPPSSPNQFHSSRLKDPATQEKKSDAPSLEDQATKAQPAILALKIGLQQGSINATQYAENVNTILVSALQVTAEKFLGTTAFRGKNAQKEHMTQRGQQDNGHYSSNDNRIAAKQTSTQTLSSINSDRQDKRSPLRM